MNNQPIKETDLVELNEIRKMWNSLKAESGSRWCMPDPTDDDRKLLTIGALMYRMESRMNIILEHQQQPGNDEEEKPIGDYTKGFLHIHPFLERQVELDPLHVIIDSDDWEKARRATHLIDSETSKGELKGQVRLQAELNGRTRIKNDISNLATNVENTGLGFCGGSKGLVTLLRKLLTDW